LFRIAADFSAKTAVFFNVLDDKGRFVDNRILGNAVSKIYLVTKLDLISKADGCLYNERLSMRTFQD